MYLVRYMCTRCVQGGVCPRGSVWQSLTSKVYRISGTLFKGTVSSIRLSTVLHLFHTFTDSSFKSQSSILTRSHPLCWHSGCILGYSLKDTPFVGIYIARILSHVLLAAPKLHSVILAHKPSLLHSSRTIRHSLIYVYGVCQVQPGP